MYLDTAILIKLVVREPDSFFYGEQVDGASEVWSSELAFTESWSALFRKEREGAIDSGTRRAAWQKLSRYFAHEMLGLVPVNLPILKRANRIISRCHPRIALRSLDAIHLACCEAADAFPLLTNDRIMRDAAEHLRFPLGNLQPSSTTDK